MTEKKDPKPYEVNFAPQAGYDFLNRWTLQQESYETRFHGKDVKKVSIVMTKGRPTRANFHYKDGDFNSIQSIALEGKLRDEPSSEADFEFLKSLSQFKVANFVKYE